MLVNHTKNGQTRVDVPIGIAYKENIPRARATLIAAVRDLEGVSKQTPPDVVVEPSARPASTWSSGSGSTTLPGSGRCTAAVMEASKLALDEAGIQIPYHHLQLFVENVDDDLLSRVAGMQDASGRR